MTAIPQLAEELRALKRLGSGKELEPFLGEYWIRFYHPAGGERSQFRRAAKVFEVAHDGSDDFLQGSSCQAAAANLAEIADNGGLARLGRSLIRQARAHCVRAPDRRPFTVIDGVAHFYKNNVDWGAQARGVATRTLARAAYEEISRCWPNLVKCYEHNCPAGRRGIDDFGTLFNRVHWQLHDEIALMYRREGSAFLGRRINLVHEFMDEILKPWKYRAG